MFPISRVFKKLILHPFLFYENGRSKRFFDLNYVIFQQL
ncbi:hypothetical protein LEP1GSC137_3040 [Leptospira borgpetersenii str. Noumea 25]|uniref:Uncharacterized protein n=1 Tax=Leptospira borgpetersenii str. 200701203 TaxID=1193007 RepID=M3HVU0_LEPBO|nr:hypothetical protein LEP1GSC123_2196 [Leptospira borgpetersenii str. 200701203]EMK14576.1 hypothetical protein LEP1GSC066_3623 [Leptospira sp. serovar Kenya str. Sh9]EMO08795.1 hypothetical protein LEP1GSC137_3040 [Leptospira borgpetersenii str. Noumea 25]